MGVETAGTGGLKAEDGSGEVGLKVGGSTAGSVGGGGVGEGRANFLAQVREAAGNGLGLMQGAMGGLVQGFGGGFGFGGTTATTPTAALEPHDAVKRAPSPYIIFCTDQRPVIKAAHPDANLDELGRMLEETWYAMSDEEKAPYIKQAEAKAAAELKMGIHNVSADGSQTTLDGKQAAGGGEGGGNLTVEDHFKAIARLLIEQGASLDVGDSNGSTAMHWAIKKNDFVTVRLLLEKNANMVRHKTNTLLISPLPQ